MKNLLSSTFSKEISAVLVIKLALIFIIKFLWFSNPQQHVEQSFTQTILGEHNITVKKEKY